MFDIANTTIMDIPVRVSVGGAEWIVDWACGSATVFKVTILVDFQGV